MKKINYKRFEKIMKKYYDKILKSNEKTIYIDYDIIERYYPQLADSLHDNYKTIKKSLEDYLDKIRIQDVETSLKFRNVKPVICLDRIHQKYNTKWISFEGIVKKRSMVYNQIKEVHWTCKECANDNIYRVDYNDKLVAPKDTCRFCGRKVGYELNRSGCKYEDIQLFILEEEEMNARSVFPF